MNKFYFLSILCVFISCNTRNRIDKKLLDSISEIHIQNRATDNFGGIEEYKIKDKKEITSLCNELLLLKEKNNLPTKPYDGTIVIEFMTRDKYGTEEYIDILSSRIILKPNGKYFIDYSRGQFVSDLFLSRILNYLEIDKNKVSALDNYPKTE
ncbi:hypothetical protein J2Y38_002889 [Flavobacterium sp. 2755]|uniref:hypothetical protein n=1 Tax=Flavobacterium sp. 2755 TaxID=2817765 RepID=UPI002867A2BC|nr:hypothetical protein [Flavobacterium sp. 2755]MDR6762678.1 hypothetical protein [Flavobacterium sp. 2755]